MNLKFNIVLIENGCKRHVETVSSYEEAIAFKKRWKKGAPNDQLVIQPKNAWE